MDKRQSSFHNYRKRITYQNVSDSDRHHNYSSNESIEPLHITRSKTSPAPPIIPEISAVREVRVMKPSKTHKFLEERLVLATANSCVPFMVFSSIPYVKTHRSSRFVAK